MDLGAISLHLTGLFRFAPTSAETLEPIFFAHLTLACALLLYAPYSKLIHFALVLLAPTRTLRCDTRARRHVNLWLAPLPPEQTDTYADYEARFAERMRAAGIPLDRPDPAEGT